MTDEQLALILKCADMGLKVADIAAACGLSYRKIYEVLAEHRPDRPRAARTASSDVPFKVRGLLENGWEPKRIVTVLGVSLGYVYQIRAQADLPRRQYGGTITKREAVRRIKQIVAMEVRKLVKYPDCEPELIHQMWTETVRDIAERIAPEVP